MPQSSRPSAARLRRRRLALTLGPVLAASVAALGGCEADLGPRVPQAGGTFGEIVYREACQRVSYTEDLEARRQDPSRPLDSSGASYRGLCDAAGATPPAADAPAAVRALWQQRDNVVAGTDGAAPDPLLDSLDAYLRALSPLQDDGTVPELLARSGRLLQQLAGDQGLTGALARLGRAGGIQPPQTAGGVPRALASAAGLDDVIGATLPLLTAGGAARGELEALLRAAAFELRHLSPDADAFDPERSEALLRDLAFTTRPDLGTGKPLLLALRDPRGLPQLVDVLPPYTKDPKTGLARADAEGRFLDGRDQPIPYVAPLPELGRVDAARRDGAGRALREDNQPLYRYVDLDGSLLMALLRDASRLFATSKEGGGEVDIPFGLLRGAALLAGSRDGAASKTKDGETLAYRGFQAKDAVLLDLAHGAAQTMRFRGEGAPGQDLQDLLQGLRTLMANPTDEGPLARSLQALLDAADEAKKPAYDAAKMPADSTLYDDLAPILARIFAVPPRDDGGKQVTLLEDIIEATKDPHGKALGYMTAQLMNDRGYFFMRQLGQTDGLQNLPKACTPDADEANNGLTACGVVGEFGNQPDRAAPDSDAAIDWRGKRTADPGNNRSVMQRLLHMLADTNGGRPFCNGRNASVFGGFVLFQKECDMFQMDNVARFFLLSIASPALRRDDATFAKQAASFREAIRNGRNCRCTPGDPDPKKRCEDPDAKRKCDALLMNIDDGVNGDNVLAGLMGLPGFGRYPEPPVGARALFADLTLDVPSVRRTRALLFNFVQAMDGSLTPDPVDPDNRKFTDGSGKDRLLGEEHNGVLFALEKVRGPATYPDGTANPFPNDDFYDAMRPLVDAFVRHAECFERDGMGRCASGQNAVQILADAMTVLHRHWPSARSRLFGRSFLESYGPQVRPDGAVSYEPLAAKTLGGDLLPSTAALAPILSGLTVDGQAGGKAVLPILSRLLRFVFDPSQAPAGGFTTREGGKAALRNDGQPAYADATLERVTGAKQDGKLTPYYLMADPLQRARAILDRPENQAAKSRWKDAISDAIDAFLKVRTTTGMAGRSYRFDNPRIRPVSVVMLDFLRGRVAAHKADLAGWSQQMVSDLSDVMTGPLFAALTDLGVQLDAQDEARRKTYALLRQVLDENGAGLAPLGAASGDAVQLLLDDTDLIAVGRALSGALDLQTGPIDPALTLARRGRELEQASPAITQKPMLPKLLKNLYAPDRLGIYPAWRIGEAVSEVNRARPGQGGALDQADYRALLDRTGAFLLDQQRGLPRFITIVQQRSLPQ